MNFKSLVYISQIFHNQTYSLSQPSLRLFSWTNQFVRVLNKNLLNNYYITNIVLEMENIELNWMLENLN